MVLIKVYNSLTRRKEELKPIDDKNIKMYACGITPYDEAHIGHAMQAVIFDTIRRYLEFSGYNVTYVRNFTDIDDKIIDRANEEGVDPFDLSSKYIKESKEELERLKVKPADHEPLVSEHIKDIIDFVQGLIDGGHAYERGGSVYFDVSSFPDYGKLSRRSVEDLISEEEENSEKKSPADFALWKALKPGEPTWDSPWGKGRPGWHIECSALARAYLGDSIDIHGGGVDIIFPHHENEIAQTEALTGKRFARYWLHNGLVMVGKQKMSKSLGNFYTVKEALDRYNPDVIRYMILSFSYNSNLNFDEKNLADAEKRIYYYYWTLKKINFLLNSSNSDDPEDTHMREICDNFRKTVTTSMDDNFNSAQVLASMNEFFTSINQYIDKNKKKISSRTLSSVVSALEPIKSIFSMVDEDPDDYIEGYKEKVAHRIGLDRAIIEEKIEARDQARKERDFTRADSIREELLKKGIVIMDGVDGSDWTYSPQ